MRKGAPSYITRPADEQLQQAARRGEFCYVLTPRQMGKSSMMVRASAHLEEDGYRTVVIDLTQIGTTATMDQWYIGFLLRVVSKLKLTVDLSDWWQTHHRLPVVQRFSQFFQEVVLAQVSDTVVIFVDEIDYSLGLDFAADFFAAVRSIFNARSRTPVFNRLTFIFLGVATPFDLADSESSAPFNIGRAIPLDEFSQKDAHILYEGLQAVIPDSAKEVFERIFYWTNGHPFLTQRLCKEISISETAIWDSDAVDQLVQRLFLSDKAKNETNLQFIRGYVTDHKMRSQMLKLYAQVYQGNRVREEKRSYVQNLMKVIGLLTTASGLPPRSLMVRNRIYEKAFDQAWIEETRGTPQQIEPLSKPKWIFWLSATVIVLLLIVAALFGLGVLPIDDKTTTNTLVPTEVSVESTATDTPLPTNTATATTRATAVDTATPSATPVPTISPALLPVPELQNNLCSGEITIYKSGDPILFEWYWAGSLSGQNYLEIRIGPENDLGYRLAVSAPLSDNHWSYYVTSQEVFNRYPIDASFHWQIVVMSENQITELSRSIYGCFNKQ